MKADPYWHGVYPDAKLLWDSYPFKTYRELFPNLVTATFASNPLALQQLAHRPPRPAVEPKEKELAILQKHFPDADPNDPPWDDVKTDLLAAGVVPGTITELTSLDAVRLLDRVSTAYDTQRDQKWRAESGELFKTLEPLLESWLIMSDPGELDPALRDRDWQAELPFMRWSSNGGILIGLDENGKEGLRCKDDAELPPEVMPYAMYSFSIIGGKKVNRYLLPHDTPVLADYLRFQDHKLRVRAFKGTEAWREIYERIVDPDNPDPIPREIIHAKPELVAWLNGENPNYAPTMTEYKVLKPAFVERRRRLKERGLASSKITPATDGEADPETLAELQHIRSFGVNQQIPAMQAFRINQENRRRERERQQPAANHFIHTDLPIPVAVPNADKHKKIIRRQPDNKRVRELCKLLDENRTHLIAKTKTEIGVAREYTREVVNNCPDATNLLRQARRYPHLWKSR